MRIVVMERGGKRLAAVARSWGVEVVAGQSPAVTHAAIEAAYRREVEAEERRAMHAAYVRRVEEMGR